MDELEISGKRYISTRRAGKDYKYHSDYIGQLVRGKKVVGQKVGRSWYVDEESLAAYLKDPQQNKKDATSVVKAEVPVRTEVEFAQEGPTNEIVVEVSQLQQEPPVVIEEKKEEEVIPPAVEEEKEVTEVTSHTMHIPIRRALFTEPEKKHTGLTYVEEDVQVFPEVRKAHNDARSISTSFIKDIVQDDENIAEQRVLQKVTSHRTTVFIPTLSIVFVGIVALAVVAAGSILVSSELIFEAGKPASAGYTLH